MLAAANYCIINRDNFSFLGNNHISRVDLSGLKSLEKLFVNNNSIQSLRNITLRDLRSLSLLSLDRNSVTEIRDGDLHSLGESARSVQTYIT